MMLSPDPFLLRRTVADFTDSQVFVVERENQGDQPVMLDGLPLRLVELGLSFLTSLEQ